MTDIDLTDSGDGDDKPTYSAAEIELTVESCGAEPDVEAIEGITIENDLEYSDESGDDHLDAARMYTHDHEISGSFEIRVTEEMQEKLREEAGFDDFDPDEVVEELEDDD